MTERGEGFYQQNNEQFSPKKFLYGALIGAVIGLGLIQAEETQAHSENSINETPITRSLSEVGCEELGDIDRDGTVSILDAAILLKRDVGFLQNPLDADQLKRADVNGDGLVNPLDGQLIKQKVAGIIDTFPHCGENELPVSTPTQTPEPTPIFTPTATNEPKIHDYLDMDMVVLYFDLNEEQVQKTKLTFENGVREFIWRNTCMNLNMNFDFVEITEVIGQDSMSVESMQKALENRDKTFLDYDVLHHIGNDVPGQGWSAWVRDDLGIGVSHSHYVDRETHVYPVVNSNFNSWLLRIGEHEFLHVLDNMATRVGIDRLWHADQATVYAQREGFTYDFEAGIFRDFFCTGNSSEIEAIAKRWGEVKYFDDTNGNGLPDNISQNLLGSDEELGPNWDLEKYMRSIYGVVDEHDNLVRNSIPRFTPQIDGDIEEEWDLLSDGVSWNGLGVDTNVFAAWDENYLYFAGSVNKASTFEIRLDIDSDGIWNGRENVTVLYYYPLNTIISAIGTDQSDEAREFACNEEIFQNPRVLEDGLCNGLADDYAFYTDKFGKILRDELISTKSRRVNTPGTYTFEIAIPTDYQLKSGAEVGIQLNFDNGAKSTIFSPETFYYLRLE